MLDFRPFVWYVIGMRMINRMNQIEDEVNNIKAVLAQNPINDELDIINAVLDSLLVEMEQIANDIQIMDQEILSDMPRNK
jgi:type III secretory pathway lipoprotein EscJ